MKNLKKIIISILALTYAILAVATTTFAWYTSFYKKEIEGLNLNCISDGDFYISGDKINWYKEDPVPLNTISFNTNKLNFTALTLNKDDMSLHEASIFGKPKLEKAKEGFISFTLYFYSKLDSYIYFSEDTKFTSNIVNFSFDNKIYNMQATNAIRVLIKDEINDEINIFEPINSLNQGSFGGTKDNNLGFKYFHEHYKDTSNYDKTWGKEGIRINIEEGPKTFKDLGYSDDGRLCSIAKNSYTKVSFIIWAEGFDADCINPILEDFAKNITINLSFMLVPKYMA